MSFTTKQQYKKKLRIFGGVAFYDSVKIFIYIIYRANQQFEQISFIFLMD